MKRRKRVRRALGSERELFPSALTDSEQELLSRVVAGLTLDEAIEVPEDRVPFYVLNPNARGAHQIILRGLGSVWPCFEIVPTFADEKMLRALCVEREELVSQWMKRFFVAADEGLVFGYMLRVGSARPEVRTLTFDHGKETERLFQTSREELKRIEIPKLTLFTVLEALSSLMSFDVHHGTAVSLESGFVPSKGGDA